MIHSVEGELGRISDIATPGVFEFYENARLKVQPNNPREIN
jgi:hypothetical protein